jgi:hypothetical protein
MRATAIDDTVDPAIRDDLAGFSNASGNLATLRSELIGPELHAQTGVDPDPESRPDGKIAPLAISWVLLNETDHGTNPNGRLAHATSFPGYGGYSVGYINDSRPAGSIQKGLATEFKALMEDPLFRLARPNGQFVDVWPDEAAAALHVFQQG